MTNRISVLSPQPGIKRDGTDFASRNWIDGVWSRFQRGLPRKIGGYKELINTLPNIPRKIFILPLSPNYNVYIADYASVKYLPINQFGTPIGGVVDRTPALFDSNLDNNWKFDTMFSTADNSSVLIAHAAQSMSSIDNAVETPIYFGDSAAVTPLIPTGINVSGGISVFHPFLFMFGNTGDVKWSAPNDPTTILGDARVTGSKIVAGSATRGGNTSPAGLLWSLDSLIRVTQVGITTVEFNFDTVTDESSILSSRGIVEYDGLYFWVGMDKFFVYNGTVQQIPNDMSTNFFFDNVNYAQRQKVWATKVPRFGEIWWVFPFGNATECNHAVIYNILEKTWYDTPVLRGDGYFTQVFQNPIWSGNSPNGGGNYSLWIQEKGVDQVNFDNSVTPIDSFVETSIFSLAAFGIDGQFGGVDKDIYLYRIEPDFNQTGNMTLTVKGRKYAKSPVVISQNSPYTFSPTTEKIDIRDQFREMFLKFESNIAGGFYEMGQVLAVIKSGDDRP